MMPLDPPAPENELGRRTEVFRLTRNQAGHKAGSGMFKRTARACVMLTVLQLPAMLPCLAPASARTMRVMESYPAAHAVLDARNAQYFVRFDGPVDHRISRLFITRDGRT